MGPGTGESLGMGKMGESRVEELWRAAPLELVRRLVGKIGLIRLATGVCNAERRQLLAGSLHGALNNQFSWTDPSPFNLQLLGKR